MRATKKEFGFGSLQSVARAPPWFESGQPLIRMARTAPLFALVAAALLPRAAAVAPVITTLATTRYTIDRFNLTFSLHSDEPTTVSIGAADPFGDGKG